MQRALLVPSPDDGVVVHTTTTSQIWLEPDGIIVIRPRASMQETLAAARENLALVDQLAGAVKRPRLLDLREAGPMSRDVRRFYNQPEGRQSASAMALLVDSGLSRIIGNLLFGLIGQSDEVRLFTSEDAARAWLQQFCPKR